MAKIRIMVGAALDRDAQNVFAPLVAAARKARVQLGNEAIAQTQTAKQQADKMVKDVERAAKERVRDEKSAMREINAELEKANRSREREDDRRLAVVSRDIKERVRIEKEAMREIEQELSKHNKQREKLEAAGGRDRDRVIGGIKNVGRTSGQYARTALNAGARVAGDIASGAGVDLSIGGHVSDFVARQKLASQISNSGYMPGQAGAAGVRQAPGALLGEAMSAANASAMDPTQALEGLQKFVAKTGELEVGRAILTDMAKMAKATGASLEDTVDAAGDVSNALGDIPDKAAVIHNVMASIAGQGKIGAVEIKDLAVQMAKLGAAATQFEGPKEHALAEMGALAQMARAHGGAASASQAATSVASFTNTFSKGKRLDAFNRYHVAVQNSNGELRSPMEIIKDALKATGGDRRKLSEMFSDVKAKQAVQGFATTYNKAGGGEKGIAAFETEFQKYMKIQMQQTEIDASLTERLQDADSKVQLFNNRIQQIADDTVTRLIPAFERMAPMIEKSAEAFGDFIAWASENPGKLIAGAIATSIAKASLEHVIAGGIESLMKGASGGALGTAGALGAIAALSVAAVTIGEAYIDNFFTNEAKKQKRDVEAQLTTRSEAAEARIAGTVTPERRAELEAQLVQMKSQVQEKNAAIGSLGSGFVGVASGAATSVAALFSKEIKDVMDAQVKQQGVAAAEAIKAQRDIERVLEQIRDGKIQVRPVVPTAPDHTARTAANTP